MNIKPWICEYKTWIYEYIEQNREQIIFWSTAAKSNHEKGHSPDIQITFLGLSPFFYLLDYPHYPLFLD